MTPIMHHSLYDGRRIAFRYTHGTGPCLVFLPGYMSDMSGSKATALLAEAQARGRACLLLDYSGCGASDGDFAEGMLSGWRDEVLALVAGRVPLLVEIKERFDREGIEIPFPHRTLYAGEATAPFPVRIVEAPSEEAGGGTLDPSARTG
jgi:pimeloyl-ACP methyl ester carboxylesterase